MERTTRSSPVKRGAGSSSLPLPDGVREALLGGKPVVFDLKDALTKASVSYKHDDNLDALIQIVKRNKSHWMEDPSEPPEADPPSPKRTRKMSTKAAETAAATAALAAQGTHAANDHSTQAATAARSPTKKQHEASAHESAQPAAGSPTKAQHEGAAYERAQPGGTDAGLAAQASDNSGKTAGQRREEREAREVQHSKDRCPPCQDRCLPCQDRCPPGQDRCLQCQDWCLLRQDRCPSGQDR